MSLRDKIKRQKQANGNSPESSVQPADEAEDTFEGIYTLSKELNAKIEKYRQERKMKNGGTNR